MKDKDIKKTISNFKSTIIWLIKAVFEWLITQPRITRLSMVVFVAVAAYFSFFQWQAKQREDSSGPEIIMDAETVEVSVEDNEAALLQGITAVDRKDGDVTDSIVVENLSAFVSEGKRKVTYVAFDSDNHISRKSRSVVYKDYSKPRFALTAPLQFPINSKELLSGLTVTDCIDGDITSTVKFLPQGEFTVDTAGTYQIEFRAVNSAGDVAIFNAPLEIYEQGTNRGPQITLSNYLIYLNKGDSFDPEDYLSTIKLNHVYDIVKGEGNYDMDPHPEGERIVVGTNYIDIDSKVNTEIPGTYTVTYSRTVDAGNQDTVTGSVQLIVIVTDDN